MNTYRVTFEGEATRRAWRNGRPETTRFVGWYRFSVRVEARTPREARDYVLRHGAVHNLRTGETFIPISRGLGADDGLGFSDDIRIISTRKVS